MLKSVFIVISHPKTGVGKGWVTAGLARLLPNGYPLKIEPFLGSNSDTTEAWPKDQSDAATYQKLGFDFDQFRLSVSDVLNDFLAYTNPNTKTQTDFEEELSNFLSQKIQSRIEQQHAEHAVIEIGGNLDHPDHYFVDRAIRLLSFRFNAPIRPVVVTHLESEKQGNENEKKNSKKFDAISVSRAIELCRGIYGEPFLVLLRHRIASPPLEQRQANEWRTQIAQRTELHPRKIAYVPYKPHVQQFCEHLGQYILPSVLRNDHPRFHEPVLLKTK